MKKIITLVCYLSTAVLFAQEKGNTFQIEETKPNWSIILSKLDTTQIKSGVLIDSS